VTMDPNAKSTSNIDDSAEFPSCDSRFSRKEFLRRFIAPAVITGVLLQPARIVDRFSLQPAAAANTGAYAMGGGAYPAGWHPPVRRL
jgi:hypothetical protein